jgi:GNAT superfamily N-acetyltransferase
MAIQWDLLRPLISVPYVPTLGPVYPEAVTAGLFADVAGVAGTSRFLPYDKDCRWGGSKDSQLLTRAITHEPGLVLLPTLSIRRAARVKVHIYSLDPRTAVPRAAKLCRRLCQEYDAAKGLVAWFLPPGSDPDSVAACTRVQLRTFTAATTPAATPSAVLPLEDAAPPVRATFESFAMEMAAGGFGFLHGRMSESGTGPVLTCQRDGMIVGAIGPMEIMPDSQGRARLLPQYFGVLPGYRGRGLGRALWRAAMRWGQEHEADYQNLQTEAGGASDQLCRSEGLTDLGLVCTLAL